MLLSHDTNNFETPLVFQYYIVNVRIILLLIRFGVGEERRRRLVVLRQGQTSSDSLIFHVRYSNAAVTYPRISLRPEVDRTEVKTVEPPSPASQKCGCRW